MNLSVYALVILSFVLTGCGKHLSSLPSYPDYKKVDKISDKDRASPGETEVFWPAQIKQNPLLYYAGLRRSVLEMIEAYDYRSRFNRGMVYAGAGTSLALSATSSGFAAFGAAATATAKLLPVVSTFINGLSGMFDNHALAAVYTEEANRLREAVYTNDRLILQEPDIDRQVEIVSNLYEDVMQVISRLELAMVNQVESPAQLISRAEKAKEKVEIAAGVRPSIKSINRLVAGVDKGVDVKITGSGFDGKTELLINGDAKDANVYYVRVIDESHLVFTMPKPLDKKKVTKSVIGVRNRYGKVAMAENTFIQARLKVDECKASTDNNQTVINVLGQGFQKAGGKVELKDKAGKKINAKVYWRAHTMWELVSPAVDVSKPIHVCVTNGEHYGEGSTLPKCQTLTCSND